MTPDSLTLITEAKVVDNVKVLREKSMSEFYTQLGIHLRVRKKIHILEYYFIPLIILSFLKLSLLLSFCFPDYPFLLSYDVSVLSNQAVKIPRKLTLGPPPFFVIHPPVFRPL